MAASVPALEKIREEELTTVIADDLEIKGAIRCKSSVMLKGIFEGEIYSEGLLVVGPTAKVTATITTKTLISHGEITGNVTANEEIILKDTSTQAGDLKTSFLTIDDGAIFNGRSVMERFKAKENQTEEVTTIPYENATEETTAPEQSLHEAIEDKRAPFVIPRQDQKKKHGKDKISNTEFGKGEEIVNAAEQTDSEDKGPF